MHEFWSSAPLPADIVVFSLVFCILLGPPLAVSRPLRRLQLASTFGGLAIPPNLAANLGQEVQFDSS